MRDDLPVGIERHGDLGPGQRERRGAQLAAHQPVEREFDPHRLRAEIRRGARTDFDIAQYDGRRRQNAHVDGAADPHRLAGDARGFSLKIRAVLSPIDKCRPDQRRHQRQDRGNRQSKQRGLHVCRCLQTTAAAAPRPSSRKVWRLLYVSGAARAS